MYTPLVYDMATLVEGDLYPRARCIRFLQRAWRPQGIATTIYACCPFCMY